MRVVGARGQNRDLIHWHQKGIWSPAGCTPFLFVLGNLLQSARVSKWRLTEGKKE